MDEIKRLRSSRRGYRTHLRRLTSRVTEILEQDNHSCAEITGLKDLREQLQRKKDILINLDESVVGLIEGEDKLEAEVCEAEDIQALISENISQINGFLELRERQPPEQPIVKVEAVVQTQRQVIPETPLIQPVNQSSHLSPVSLLSERDNEDPPSNETDHNTSPHPRSSQGITRLPKLNIPNFSGESLQWQSFWDCFEAAVHSNTCLTGVQKLNYLRAQLQGDAAKVVSGFLLSNANYEHSIALLTQRYGQPHCSIIVSLDS